MIKTVLSTQDVPVASGRGPLTTQPNGDLQMQSAAANLAMGNHVLNLQLTIMLMATPAEVLMLRTVLMTQVALAVTGLGLLWIQPSGALLMLNVGAKLVAMGALLPHLLLLLILVMTMNMAMIAQLYKARIAASLTVYNAHGLGLNLIQQDGMVLMPDADANISKVT
jgi:hypothetical protein